ncbi:MAG: hypothetical protein LBM73_01950 [Candidatus Nomurabacteria bacterium]|jgi:hypothetical protein|nr:hypothetical protein [Candidatus Nomurabacteria bacterium]
MTDAEPGGGVSGERREVYDPKFSLTEYINDLSKQINARQAGGDEFEGAVDYYLWQLESLRRQLHNSNSDVRAQTKKTLDEYKSSGALDLINKLPDGDETVTAQMITLLHEYAFGDESWQSLCAHILNDGQLADEAKQRLGVLVFYTDLPNMCYADPETGLPTKNESETIVAESVFGLKLGGEDGEAIVDQLLAAFDGSKEFEASLSQRFPLRSYLVNLGKAFYLEGIFGVRPQWLVDRLNYVNAGADSKDNQRWRDDLSLSSNDGYRISVGSEENYSTEFLQGVCRADLGMAIKLEYVGELLHRQRGWYGHDSLTGQEVLRYGDPNVEYFPRELVEKLIAADFSVAIANLPAEDLVGIDPTILNDRLDNLGGGWDAILTNLDKLPQVKVDRDRAYQMIDSLRDVGWPDLMEYVVKAARRINGLQLDDDFAQKLLECGKDDEERDGSVLDRHHLIYAFAGANDGNGLGLDTFKLVLDRFDFERALLAIPAFGVLGDPSKYIAAIREKWNSMTDDEKKFIPKDKINKWWIKTQLFEYGLVQVSFHDTDTSESCLSGVFNDFGAEEPGAKAKAGRRLNMHRYSPYYVYGEDGEPIPFDDWYKANGRVYLTTNPDKALLPVESKKA